MIGRIALLSLLMSVGAFVCAQDEPSNSKNSGQPVAGQQEASNQEASKVDPSKQDPSKQDLGKRESGKQEPDRPAGRDLRSDRETREIFFRTLNETRSRGAQEFGYLLFQKSVREEVGLDDASAKAAREVLSKSRASGEKLYEQLKNHRISADELKTEFLKVMADADREMLQVLDDSAVKRDRLVGLYVQLHKASAVLNKVVAEKVGVEEVQRNQIISKKETIEREMFEEASSENAGPADRFRSWEKTQKKVHTVITEMLSEEQRAKLEGLKGEPFEFEQFPFPPPGSRGRDRRNREERDDKCRDCDKLVTDQR